MDLSLNCPAFCVADIEAGQIEVVHLSHVNNKKKTKWTHAQKLNETSQHIRQLLKDYGPFDDVVRERGFSQYNKTTQVLFKTVGISDLTLYEYADVLSVVEYPPTTIKQTITGTGKAKKDEVADAVRKFLKDEQKDIHFETDDESDSVAVAITYAIKNNLLPQPLNRQAVGY